jgi:hypothetical protein
VWRLFDFECGNSKNILINKKSSKAQRINVVTEEQLRQIVKETVAELYDRIYQNSPEMVVEILMNNIPYDVIINTKIIRDYEISKVLHFPPVNGRMQILKKVVYPNECFPDDGEISFYSMLGLEIALVDGEMDTLRECFNIANSFQDILQ